MAMSAKGFEMACVAVGAVPEGEDRFWKWETLPVQSPDADRPSEGQSGPEGNNFWKDPLRTIPALERKVIECSF